MPVSKRSCTVAAAIVGYLPALLPALMILVAEPATAAATRSATAHPAVTAPVAAPMAVVTSAAPMVTVAVTPVGAASPTYRIDVRNSGDSTVGTTVRQELPQRVAPTGISNGGQATAPNGPDRGTEVSWQLQLGAHDAMSLTTVLAPTVDSTPVTAPACAFAIGGDTPYDCATATWDAAVMNPAAPAPPPWWRHPAVLGGAVVALLVLAVLSWLGYRIWNRRTILRRAASRQRSGVAVYDPNATRGTLYPRPAAPRPRARRRPPAWLAVGVAIAILGGVVAGAVWTATARVSAMQTDRQPSNGAWIGQSRTGPVGAPLQESAFEFTVYRVSCPPGTQHCQATVGLRNLTQEKQTWYGALQRAYLPDGNWVGADEAATRAANQGRDLFSTPVPAGGRLLFPLVFNTAGRELPTQLELRSAVFSAGVRVDVT
ncbi:hypothetical protein GCM10027290_47510 [Micromonospora sonneratiae]|uniref:DUF4352 domain-containing protein n=1 Tax=Micromonospora sonneratiae TaxID=1184706 RepID=A0ABW3YES8_9ACTN